MSTSRRVLILGIGSVIGYAVANQLLDQDYSVTGLCSTPTPLVGYLSERGAQIRFNHPKLSYRDVSRGFDHVIDASGYTGFHGDSNQCTIYPLDEIYGQNTLVLSSTMQYQSSQGLEPKRWINHFNNSIKEAEVVEAGGSVLRLCNVDVVSELFWKDCDQPVHFPEAIRQYILTRRKDALSTFYRQYLQAAPITPTVHPETTRDLMLLSQVAPQVLQILETPRNERASVYASVGRATTVAVMVQRSYQHALQTLLDEGKPLTKSPLSWCRDYPLTNYSIGTKHQEILDQGHVLLPIYP